MFTMAYNVFAEWLNIEMNKQGINQSELARRADGYSPDTISQYDWALSRFRDYIGDKPITDVTLHDARQYIVWMQTDYKGGSLSPVSIFHAWKAIRAFYKWLEDEFKTDNIMQDLHKPPFKDATVTPYTNDEIEKILKASVSIDHKDPRRSFTRRAPMAERNRLLILFLLDTGLRVGELTRLNVGDVNIETCEVQVHPFRSSRKSKPRVVYVGRRVQKELWKYLLERSPADPLFESAHCRRMSGDSIKHLLDRIGKRANVSNVHPHRFRHTFAIQSLRAGMDIFSLQRLLGHASLSMVRRYLALAQSDLEAAHRRASPVDNWRL